MAQVKFLTVQITKDKMTTLSTTVPQWEAQVLVALWGEDAIISGETYKERPLPEANDEFVRLANKYGPRDEEVPAVAKVYGSFGPGLRALEAEFAASVAAEANVPAPKIDPNSDFARQANGESDGAQAPDVRDDVPALAGNTVQVDGETKPIAEVLQERKRVAADESFADLTGEPQSA